MTTIRRAGPEDFAWVALHGDVVIGFALVRHGYPRRILSVARTRGCGRTAGSRRVAVIDPFPGRQPGNPAALFVRELRVIGPGNE